MSLKEGELPRAVFPPAKFITNFLQNNSLMASEVKFQNFQVLLKEIDIYEKYMFLLLENGFEDWESLKEIKKEMLLEIGK